MSETDPEDRRRGTNLLRILNENWPVLSGLAIVIALAGETRWQVQSLILDKDKYTRQWQVIAKHGNDIADAQSRLRIVEINSSKYSDILNEHIRAIVDLQSRLTDIERHVTPQAVQEWGAIKEQFRQDHEDLKEHLREHRSN